MSNYTTHSIIHYVIQNYKPPNTDVACGNPAGHPNPKLVQLETSPTAGRIKVIAIAAQILRSMGAVRVHDACWHNAARKLCE